MAFCEASCWLLNCWVCEAPRPMVPPGLPLEPAQESLSMPRTAAIEVAAANVRSVPCQSRLTDCGFLEEMEMLRNAGGLVLRGLSGLFFLCFAAQVFFLGGKALP